MKPNVGHSEGVLGITSIIKAVLSIENDEISPNINFLYLIVGVRLGFLGDKRKANLAK
jgi:hypothetical protein